MSPSSEWVSSESGAGITLVHCRFAQKQLFKHLVMEVLSREKFYVFTLVWHQRLWDYLKKYIPNLPMCPLLNFTSCVQPSWQKSTWSCSRLLQFILSSATVDKSQAVSEVSSSWNLTAPKLPPPPPLLLELIKGCSSQWHATNVYLQNHFSWPWRCRIESKDRKIYTFFPKLSSHLSECYW